MVKEGFRQAKVISKKKKSQLHIDISLEPEVDSAATVKQTHPFLTHALAKPCLVPPFLPSRLCLLRIFFNVGFSPSEFSSLLPVCSS